MFATRLTLLLVPLLCLLCAGRPAGAASDSAHATADSWCDGQMLEPFSTESEIVSKRTLTAKHFRNQDGTCTAVVSSAPVHYLKHNKWSEIDTRILECADHPYYAFCNGTNNFQTCFPVDSGGPVGSKLTYGGADLIHSLDVRLSWIDASGSEYAICPISAVNPRVEGSKIIFQDDVANVKIEFAVTSVGLRRAVILERAPACVAGAQDGRWLNIVERLVLPAGYYLSLRKEKQSHAFSAAGPVEIRAPGGNGFVTMDPLTISNGCADGSPAPVRGQRTFEFIGDDLYCYSQIPFECLRRQDKPADDEGNERGGPSGVRASTVLRPNDEAWWTGFMDPYWFGDPANNYGCGDADIIVGTPDLVYPFGIFRGWAKFDISSIEGEVTDSTLDIYTFQTLWDKGMHVDYYSIDNVDPQYAHFTDANVQTLYADCQDGTLYYNNKWWPTDGWVGAVDLGPAADDDIENPWAGTGWWAVGFSSDTPVGGDPVGEALKGTGYNGGANAPKLTVTYAPPCPNPGGSGKYCAADVYPNNDDGVWNYADDGDCVVGISDLAQLLGNYGLASGATREDGDIYPVGSGDGAVNISDLGEMLGQYGDDCN